MPKTQYFYVQRKTSESGQTGTATYDLPETGVIPEIVVRAYSTPTASTNPALPLIDAITKIEIVDGAKVIKSLTGNQIKALEMIHKTRSLNMTSTDEGGVEGYEEFTLILGKFLNGRFYAPDFSRFDNPQIKITWDYSQTTTDKGMSCDADTSPNMKFTVLAKVLREGASYTHGYIKSVDVRTWTQSASTTEVTEIPRDGHLVGIGIECGYDAKNITDDLAEVKLDFDNGAWVPLHLYDEDVVACQQEFFGGPFEVTFRKDVKDGIEVDVHMGYVTNISVTDVEGKGGLTYAYPSDPSGIETLNVYASDGTSYGTYHVASFNVKGFIPFHVWYVPAKALAGTGQDTIDTSQFRRIVLETKSGANVSTSSTPTVIAEYLVTG